MENRDKIEKLKLNRAEIVANFTLKILLSSLLTMIAIFLLFKGQYSYMLLCLFFLLALVLISEAYIRGVKDFIIKTNIGEIGVKMQETTKDFEKVLKDIEKGKAKSQEIDTLENKVNDINTAIKKANAFIDKNDFAKSIWFHPKK
jgi:hypothetical protein